MSYLLGYQKWKSLHESAEYNKLFEQAFNPATGVDFILLAGTSPTPIYDAGLSKLGMKVTGTGTVTKLYEISLIDALSGNFQNLVEIKELNANDIKDRDRVQVLSGENIVAEISGPGEITFAYTPQLKDTKLRVSGNGALALHRAATELKTASVLDLNKHKGNIKFYVDQEKSAVADSPRFSKFITSLGTGLDALIAKANTFSVTPALHYLVNGEDNKKFIEDTAPNSFKSLESYDPAKGLNDNPIFLVVSGGNKYFGTQNPYTALDSMKGIEPDAFWTNPTVDLDARTLKPEILAAIQEYVNVCLDNFTKEGGTIDQYYKNNFNQIGSDLLETLLIQARAKSNRAKEQVKAASQNQIVSNAKILIGRQETQAGDKRPTAAIGTEKKVSTYGEGESGK
jgi:hypothetical protein